MKNFLYPLQVSDKGTIFQKLNKFLMTHRTTPHPSTQRTPSEVLMKRKIPTTLDLMFPTGIGELERVRKRMLCSDSMKPHAFAAGEKMFVRDYTSTSKPWVQGIITKRKGDVIYLVNVRGKSGNVTSTKLDGQSWRKATVQENLLCRKTIPTMIRLVRVR